MISSNLQKYCLNVEKQLPSTITESIRGFDFVIEPLNDLSGFHTIFIIKLDKRMTHYHSLAIIHEILWKSLDISPVAIRHTEAEPSFENNYSDYRYEVDLHYYKYPR